jgi:hypothetical protein
LGREVELQEGWAQVEGCGITTVEYLSCLAVFLVGLLNYLKAARNIMRDFAGVVTDAARDESKRIFGGSAKVTSFRGYL